MSYARFAAMIATSTALMFCLTYLTTYEVDHLAFSQTRLWMALVMGAAMALVMLGFMLSMYKSRRANIAIVAASITVFAGALWCVRSQRTVDDVAYMKAMIPHHSIAVMTSRRAQITDPRVRALADKITETQVEEIAQMRRLIANIEARPAAD